MIKAQNSIFCWQFAWLPNFKNSFLNMTQKGLNSENTDDIFIKKNRRKKLQLLDALRDLSPIFRAQKQKLLSFNTSYIIYFYMKSLTQIPELSPTLRKMCTQSNSRQPKSIYEEMSPKSSLQLKLKQVMAKSQKNQGLQVEFEELRKLHERSVKTLAEKEGQLLYYKDKNQLLQKKSTLMEKVIRSFTETLNQILATLQMKTSTSLDELSFDCDDSDLEETQRLMLNSLKFLEQRMLELMKERTSTVLQEGIQCIAASKSTSSQLSTKNLGLPDILEQQKISWRGEKEVLENKLKQQTAEVEKFRRQEEEFEEMAKGVDLRIKTRQEVSILLKGVVKKYRRHQKICTMKQGLDPLKSEQLEGYVQEKMKMHHSKKQTKGKILDFE